ncbi:hypothetical protein [Pseudomonas sp. 18173]|uniref:hypothetical protein n=1 Tax=Pseudomonas sp. 18173 TaxID=3390055 RepID=UPI003D218BEE
MSDLLDLARPLPADLLCATNAQVLKAWLHSANHCALVGLSLVEVPRHGVCWVLAWQVGLPVLVIDAHQVSAETIVRLNDFHLVVADATAVMPAWRHAFGSQLQVHIDLRISESFVESNAALAELQQATRLGAQLACMGRPFGELAHVAACQVVAVVQLGQAYETRLTLEPDTRAIERYDQALGRAMRSASPWVVDMAAYADLPKGAALLRLAEHGRLYPIYDVDGGKNHRVLLKSPLPSLLVPAALGAGDGRSVIVGGYRELALRVAAELAQDSTLVGLLDRGDEPSQFMADAFWGDHVYRIDGSDGAATMAESLKRLLVGGGGKMLVEGRIAATGDQAEALVALFHKLFPDLHALQKSVEAKPDEAAKTAYFKRRLIFDAHDNHYTCALSHCIQGTAGEVWGHAVIALHNSLPRDNSVCIQHLAHDFVVLSVQCGCEGKARALILEALRYGFLKVFPGASMRCLVLIGLGDVWSKAVDAFRAGRPL